MTATDLVLARLAKPREVAPGRWRARCPAHDGLSTSALSVTQGDDGRVLVHCFHGCDVLAVVGALGLGLEDLFPPRPSEPGSGTRPVRSPFLPAQVFEVVQREAAVVSIVAGDMLTKRSICVGDYVRLSIAQQRLADVARSAYGRR